MKYLQTFERFLNENLNESAKRKNIMDKVAKALKTETKPMNHKDFLGFDDALILVDTKEPLMISLVDNDKELLFYKDNGDSTETISKYPVKDLEDAIESIEKYINESVNEASVFSDFSREEKSAWRRAENKFGKTFFTPNDKSEYENLMRFLATKEWFFWNTNSIAGFPENEPIDAEALPKWKTGISFELGGTITGSKFVIPVEMKADQQGGAFDYEEFSKII